MTAGINLAEAGHIVNILPPIDITGGVLGDRFSMANHARATIIVQIGVSAAAFTKIIINEANAATSGTAQAIAFNVYKEETAAGDTLGARTAVAAAGVTPNAADTIFYVIDIDARELTDGFNFIELSLTNGVNAVLASAVAILTGSRHASAESASVLA